MWQCNSKANALTLLLHCHMHVYTALFISDDARVEITCTGSGLSSLPQWSINGTNVAAHTPAVLRDIGIAIIPESIIDAFDENNNFFQTFVINGSALIHGTTIQCLFAGEVVFPSTELGFLAALPPPEDLTVSEGGLVQWQPPYSSLETEAIRYFLYNISYSVEVTDTLTQETIIYDETGSTSFSFQPPADCIEYTVTVTARGATSVGDPAAVTVPATGEYALPEPVNADDVTATLQGITLTITVVAQYELINCSRPTDVCIIYAEQQYTMPGALELEFSVEYNSSAGVCFSITASNPAGHSDPTQFPTVGMLTVCVDSRLHDIELLCFSTGCESCDATTSAPPSDVGECVTQDPSVVALVGGVVGGVAVIMLLVVIAAAVLSVVVIVRKHHATQGWYFIQWLEFALLFNSC